MHFKKSMSQSLAPKPRTSQMRSGFFSLASVCFLGLTACPGPIHIQAERPLVGRVSTQPRPSLPARTPTGLPVDSPGSQTVQPENNAESLVTALTQAEQPEPGLSAAPSASPPVSSGSSGSSGGGGGVSAPVASPPDSPAPEPTPSPPCYTLKQAATEINIIPPQCADIPPERIVLK